MNKVTLFLLVIVSASILLACDDTSSPGSTEIQIADKTFIIPEKWQYWQYAEIANADNEKYKQLRLTVDVVTFEPIKPSYKNENTRNLHIEIRPLRAEFGEKYYWTNHDPVLGAQFFGCHEYTYNSTPYKFCKNGKSPVLVDGGDIYYSIQNLTSQEYVSIIGCMTPDKYKHLNPVCNARSRLLDNLQIEYHYRLENFNRAIEIDQKIHEVVSKLYSPEENRL